MHLKDIVSTLMLSDFYFSLPLWERKQVVLRLWSRYGGTEVHLTSPGSGSFQLTRLRADVPWPKS